MIAMRTEPTNAFDEKKETKALNKGRKHSFSINKITESSTTFLSTTTRAVAKSKAVTSQSQTQSFFTTTEAPTTVTTSE
ncbi:unnamed protein product, partial [Litomosoides sigmodontis]